MVEGCVFRTDLVSEEWTFLKRHTDLHAAK